MDDTPTRDQRGNEQTRANINDAGRPSLNTAVRRRRGDRAFYLRLAGAIRQQERALERLK